MFKKLTFPLVGLLIGMLCVSTALANSKNGFIMRVAVLRDVDDFVVKIRGKFTIKDAVTQKILGTGMRLSPNQVRQTSLGLAIGKSQFTTDRLIIEPAQDANLYINQRRLRGHVVVIATKENKIHVVNHIELEDYTKGVLYHEISHKWPMEAIKAQAVATRTYAIYSAGNRREYDWDVTNDIYSQVYGGKDSERYRTNLAVDRTKHEVLMFDGKILPAFFHADSGGHTEDASELWNINILTLKGVVSPYSKGSPHSHWKKNLQLKEIQSKLNEKGYNLGLIKDIKVLERNKSGRVRRLAIETRDGKYREVSGKDFREIIGPNTIRSNRYKIDMQGYFVDFIGEGWGHGVGLCQWGARGMAKRRYKYDQILQFYYPGASIVDYRKQGF